MARLLVVDDEIAIVQLIKMILETAGHEVCEAYNGQEALKALGVDPPDEKAALPDAMLLDVMMPIVDGYTVAMTLKSHSRCARIPIIVATAKPSMRPMFEALPNVVAFFAKPFDPQRLRDAVVQALKPR